MGASEDDRINALGAINAAAEAKQAAESLMKAAGNLANASQSASQGVSFSLTYGQQQASQNQHSEGNTLAKSQLVSEGGRVDVTLTGAGESSTFQAVASDIKGSAGTKVSAEGKVSFEAGAENHLERSDNKSSGFSVGGAFGSDGVGISAGGNRGKGYGNGESQSWVASQIGDANSKTEISSGQSLEIIGSQAHGKRVEAKAQNLTITSLQDTMHYEGKQQNASGEVTVGLAPLGASGQISSLFCIPLTGYFAFFC